MKVQVLSLLLLSMITSHSRACSCLDLGSFCTSTHSLYGESDLIVRAVKLSDVHYGMTIKVQEVIKGATHTDILTVWGDNGALCRRYTASIPTGQPFVFALDSTDFMGNFIINPSDPNGLEQAGDYHLPGCGTFLLEIQGNSVQGNIDGAHQTMDYGLFKQLVQSGCKVTGLPPGVPIAPVLDAYPNPTRDRLALTLSFPIHDAITVNLINLTGQYAMQATIAAGEVNAKLDLQHLPAGLYSLRLTSGNYEWVKKVVLTP